MAGATGGSNSYAGAVSLSVVLRSHLLSDGKERRPGVENFGQGARKWPQTIGKRIAF